MSVKSPTMIPASKVNNQLLKSGINADNCEQLEKLTKALYDIQKTGAEKPASLDRFVVTDKTPAAEIRAHKAAQEKHAEDLKAYNKYSSTAYTTLKRQHKLLRCLEEIVAFHAEQAKRTAAGSTITKSAQAALDAAIDTLHAKAPEKSADETQEQFDAKLKRFNKMDFTKIVQTNGLTDRAHLQSAAAVPKLQSLIDKIRAQPNMSVLIEHHKLSSDNYRGNDTNGVVLSAAVTAAVNTLLVGGFRQLSNTHTKLQTSDIVRGHTSGTFSDAFTNLRIWKEAAARAAREDTHAAGELPFVQAKMREAYAANAAKKRSDILAEYPSFGAAEAQAGHAKAVQVTTKSKNATGKPKTVYVWPAIDWVKDESENDYTPYIKKMAKETRAKLFDFGTSGASSTIAKTTTRFLSDLVSQFIEIVAKSLKLTLETYKIKTLRYEQTICAVQQLFLGYSLDTPELAKLIDTMHRAGKGASKGAAASPASAPATVSASPAPAAAAAADEEAYDEESDSSAPAALPVPPAAKPSPKSKGGK